MSGVETRPVPIMILRWPKIRDLITQQKFIYVHLYHHPDSSTCGCYLLGIESTAADLGMTANTLRDAIDEFRRRGLLDLDKDTGEVYVIDWPRWHLFKTPAALGALRSSVNRIQSKKLLITVKNAYKSTLDGCKGKDKVKDKVSSLEEEMDGRLERPQKQKQAFAKPYRSEAGILCWTEDDKFFAENLLKAFGKEIIQKTVAELETEGVEPLPSRVSKILNLVSSPLPKGIPKNWLVSDDLTILAGNAIDLQARRGESMEAYRQRIKNQIYAKS